MAKKAKVKQRLTANTAPMDLSGLTAHSGPMDIPTIGANLGSLAQDIDTVEQSNKVDKLRKSAKERIKQRVPAKPSQGDKGGSGNKVDVIPPGTFKNVDGELVVGDMNKFREAQITPKKKQATVKKK